MMSGAHLFITRFRGFLSSFEEHFAKANAFCDIKVEPKCDETFHDAYLRALASDDWQIWTLQLNIECVYITIKKEENIYREELKTCAFTYLVFIYDVLRMEN